MLAEQGWRSIFELPVAQLAIIGGLAVGFVISIVSIIASYWYQSLKVRSENMLKRTLVERGMSVDEIERIMVAGHEEKSET